MISAYTLAHNRISEDEKEGAGREGGFSCSCQTVLIAFVLVCAFTSF